MKKAEFLSLVVSEINHIKEKGTTEEKSNLDIDTFNHWSFRSCIYGQMTGDCSSVRAKELTPKSYLYVSDRYGKHSLVFSKQLYNEGDSFTHLEKYLYMVKQNVHKNIINYIKGVTQTLNIK